MNENDLLILQDYIAIVECLLCVTIESCEHNMYNIQQTTLEEAEKYLKQVREIASNLHYELYMKNHKII